MSGRAYAVRHTATAAATRPGAATQPGARGDAGEKPVDLISQGAEAAADGGDAGQRILAPEDLCFARALRNDSANAPEPEPARPVPAMPQTTAVAAPGQGSQNAQPGQSAPGGVSTSPFAPAVPEGQAPSPAPAATMFDYVFQVAAFKDEYHSGQPAPAAGGQGAAYPYAARRQALPGPGAAARGDAPARPKCRKSCRSCIWGNPLCAAASPPCPEAGAILF